MRTLLRLSVLPLIGLLLVAASLFLNRHELRLRFGGDETHGTVAGMVIAREGGADLIDSIDMELRLTLADGRTLSARFHNGARMDKAAAGAPLSPVIEAAIAGCARGDATLVRWVLMRESRRDDAPDRIVRIEMTETVEGYLDLPGLPERIGVVDGRVVPLPAGAAPGTIVTRAVFDNSDPARLKANKGESLVEFRQLRGGMPAEPDKQNFVLFCEPYSTVFRPVFRYSVGSEEYAGVSHIGRHGGPTLAIRLFNGCFVYYESRHPEASILIADPGGMEGGLLAWFSRACEGVFAQWGSGSLILLAGLIFLATGFGFISLAIWPSGNLVKQPA